jgi:hypothetical protein
VNISLVNDIMMGHSDISPRNSQRGMGRGINDRRDFFSLGCFFQRMAYTSEEFRLRVSKDRLRVTTRLNFRTCFAKQTGSIVMTRQFASCRFRLEILLSYQGTPMRRQSSHSMGIYLHDLCSIDIQISVYMYSRAM